MRWFSPFLFVVEISNDRMAGKCLERELGDESQRIGRHDHVDLAVLLDKLAGEISRLVSRNRAGHAQNDIPAHSKFRGWPRSARICSAWISERISRTSAPIF